MIRKDKKIYLRIIILCLFIISIISGCASIPQRSSSLPAYYINGTTYYPVVSLCSLRNISWNYDVFARVFTMSKEGHTISLKPGDNLVLVDGASLYIDYPVEIHKGAVVVPRTFKESTLDRLYGPQERFVSRQPETCWLNIRRVVVDPGHGGHDPGAVGRSGIKEKDVNLDIAKRLTTLLKQRGVEVIMTRSTDRFISLHRRADIANTSKADLFISVHSNASRSRSLSGFEVYYVSPTVNDSDRSSSAARTADLNTAALKLASNSANLKAILWDILYTNSRAESIEVARQICRAAEGDLGVKILGVKPARFEVLRVTRMPAILVEVGFLSNSTEELKLKNSYYRQKVAEAICRGIGEYSKEALFVEALRR